MCGIQRVKKINFLNSKGLFKWQRIIEKMLKKNPLSMHPCKYIVEWKHNSDMNNKTNKQNKQTNKNAKIKRQYLKNRYIVWKLKAQVFSHDYWTELNLHVTNTLWPQIKYLNMINYFQNSSHSRLEYWLIIGGITLQPNAANIYMCKVNNRNTCKRCEICSKSTIKTPERRRWHSTSAFSLLKYLTSLKCIQIWVIFSIM